VESLAAVEAYYYHGLLGLIRRQNAQVPVVVMTAYGSIETRWNR
jgi:DNA-binding NtrC family response regulator